MGFRSVAQVGESMTRSVAFWAGLAVFLAAAPAWADRVLHVDNIQILPSLPLEDVVTVTPSVGTSINVGGSYVKGGEAQIASAGTLFSQAISGATVFSTHTKGFADTFEQPLQVALNVNYGLSNFDEAYLGLRWFFASGNRFPLMTSSNAVTWGNQPIAAGGTVYGKFSDTSELGIEAGYHHFFEVGWPGFHPYGGVLLGMKRTSAVNLALTNASGGTITNTMHFYNAGLVGQAGLTFGFRYDIDQLCALGLESGGRYEGPLSPNKSEFLGTGFTGINSGGDRWDIPTMVTLTAKF